MAQVDSNLAIRDRKRQIESVRYSTINPMLLNEFLKEHRKVEELQNDFQATIAQQQKEIQALTAQVKEQAAEIRRVSDQAQIRSASVQTVTSSQ